MKKWISFLCTILLMGLIFYLSAQPGEISRELSRTVTDQVHSSGIGNVVAPQWFDALNPHANLRKWAHLYLFFAFGASAAVTAKLWFSGKMRVISVPFCLIWAASDEVHQFFVPGRTALLQDVILDGAGIVAGTILVYVFSSLLHKLQREK